MEEPTDVSVGSATINAITPITAQRINLATSSYVFFIWHLSKLTRISGFGPPDERSDTNS